MGKYRVMIAGTDWLMESFDTLQEAEECCVQRNLSAAKYAAPIRYRIVRPGIWGWLGMMWENHAEAIYYGCHVLLIIVLLFLVWLVNRG